MNYDTKVSVFHRNLVTYVLSFGYTMITFKIYNILSVIILPSVNIQINKNVTQPILTMTSAISICLQTHINCSYYLLTAQSPIKIFIKKDHHFHTSHCENSSLFLNGQCSPFVSYTYRENRSPFMI